MFVSDDKYIIPNNGGKEITYMSSNTSPMKQGPGVYFTMDQKFRNADVYGEMYCILVNHVQIAGFMNPILNYFGDNNLVSEVYIYNHQFFASMSKATDLLHSIYETYQAFDKPRKLNLEYYPDFEHNRFMVKRKYTKTNTMTLVSYQISKMSHGNFQARDSILESMVEEEDDA